MPLSAVRLVRDRPTWLMYGQLGLWAYFLYAFTPIVPLLRAEQHTSRMVASLHGTAFAAGSVLGGALLPALARRYDWNTRIWGGMAGVAVVVVGLSVSRPLAMTLPLAAVVGIFGSIAVNSITAALSGHHGAAGTSAISEANAVAAGVGIVAPLIVGAAVTLGLGWRPGLLVMAGGLIVLALVVSRRGVRIPAERVAAGAVRTGRLPRRYWLAFGSLFATGAVEMCLSQWVADVLRVNHGLSAGAATAGVSSVLAGMFVGRVVGGCLALRRPAAWVLLGGLAISMVGFGVFWFAGPGWLAIVGLGVCGIGNGVHFPLGISLAIDNSGGQPDLATSRTSYAIGLAFGAAPFALGAIADRLGTHTAFAMVPLFLAMAVGMVVPLALRGGRGGGPEVGELDAELAHEAA